MPTLFIDISLVGANDKISRVYYDPKKPFDPRGIDTSPPLCFSDNGTGPSRNSSVPQSLTCAACPHAVWGAKVSQMTGRGVPACQSGKKVAFIWPGDTDDIVYLFKVPPASLSNLAQYVKTLSGHLIGGRPCSPGDVITRVEFESQGVVKFTPIGLITEDLFNRQNKVYANPQLISQITGRDDVAIDPAQGLPNAAQPRALPPNPQPQPMAFAPTATTQAPQQLPATQGRGRPRGSTNKPRGTQETPAQAPAQAPFMPPQQPTQAPPGMPQFAPITDPYLQHALVKSVAPPSADDLSIPAFLQRAPEAPAQTAQFGMVENPAAPPNEVQAALDQAFNLPGV
jgi:hypothetical protein